MKIQEPSALHRRIYEQIEIERQSLGLTAAGYGTTAIKVLEIVAEVKQFLIKTIPDAIRQADLVAEAYLAARNYQAQLAYVAGVAIDAFRNSQGSKPTTTTTNRDRKLRTKTVVKSTEGDSRYLNVYMRCLEKMRNAALDLVNLSRELPLPEAEEPVEVTPAAPADQELYPWTPPWEVEEDDLIAEHETCARRLAEIGQREAEKRSESEGEEEGGGEDGSRE